MASFRENLTFRIVKSRSAGVWAIALMFSWFLSSNFVQAEPDPRHYYSNSLIDDPESLYLIQRMQQLIQRERELNEEEREINEGAIELEKLMEVKSGMENPNYILRQEFTDEEDRGEPLPEPLPLHNSGRQIKRGSYMALCHFKICNMGRKRQSQLSQSLRPKVRFLNPWVSLGPRTSSTLLRQPSS